MIIFVFPQKPRRNVRAARRIRTAAMCASATWRRESSTAPSTTATPRPKPSRTRSVGDRFRATIVSIYIMQTNDDSLLHE